jgi:hypothetical protein
MQRCADWYFDRPLHTQAWIAVLLLAPIIILF